MSVQTSSKVVAVPPQHPHWLAVAVASAGLACVGLGILAHRIPFFPIDLTLTRSVQRIHAAWCDAPLAVLNRLGFPPLVGVIYGTISLVIFATGRRREAVAAGFAALGGSGLNHVIKLVVARPRPDPHLIVVEHHINNGSFPAGHVLNFTAFAGFLCYLVAVRCAPSWHRTALIALLILLIALMGVARIHSGEHWPSDVLGAYLLGLIWLAASIRFYEWRGRRHPAALASPAPRGRDQAAGDSFKPAEGVIGGTMSGFTGRRPDRAAWVPDLACSTARGLLPPAAVPRPVWNGARRELDLRD